MIDLNYLNELPKMFFKESAQYKNIFTIYNEMKAEMTYVKSAIEIEVKSQENLGKMVIAAAKTFYSESASDDLTNLLKIEQIFTIMCEQVSNEFQNPNTINLAAKAFTDISDNITDFTKGSLENINALVRDLSNARTKYRGLYARTEKLFKEVELNFINKKKIESDDKNSFNQTIKEKVDDKILNIMNEFEESKAILNSSFDDCKRLEVVFNEMIKSAFVNSINFLVSSIKIFKNCLDGVCEIKAESLTRCEDKFVKKSIENIKLIEFDLVDQELRNNDLKGIKSEFGLLTYLFNSNYQNNSINNLNSNLSYTNSNDNSIINENNNTSSINENNLKNSLSLSQMLTNEAIMEEHFNKNNFVNSQFTENILSFIFSFLQTLTGRKKHITVFIKFIQDCIKNQENFVPLSSKLIKSLSIPKVSILNNCTFLIQIQEFLRSLIELIIMKEEEFTKVLVSSILNPLEHSVIKDITSDETIVNAVFQKIQKEYYNFKTNVVKLNLSKEKISQSLEKIKENIHKTSDDVNSFAKFEKQFLALRAEEGNFTEALKEAYKKYRKFLEECLEILRKTVTSYKDKEFCKMKEFKESILSCLNYKEKNLNLISEFLEYRNQIIIDNTSIKNSLKNIYSIFSKFFDLDMNEKLLTDVVSQIITIGENTNTNTNTNNATIKEVHNLLRDVIFINKDEIIPSKDFNLIELVPDEELQYYQEKLDFLKNNSRKISIRNVNFNRKMYEDIFFIDNDENVTNNFSCALSDKILLQGKLYITSKKIVFYSWFNNSTLFGKTLLEIPMENILDVEKYKNLLFDNMILVKTKTTQFLFASFINRDKCYCSIREVLFGEANPLSNVNGISSSINEAKINDSDSPNANLNMSNLSEDGIINLEDNLKSTSTFDIANEVLKSKKSKSESNSPNINKIFSNKEDINNNKDEINNISREIEFKNENLIENKKENFIINKKENLVEKNKLLINENTKVNSNIQQLGTNLKENLANTEFIQKLNNFTKNRKDKFNLQNKRNFQSVFIQNHKLGDIPLSYIYNSLYNPDTICNELGLNKNFILSFLESRKDYGFILTKIDEETWHKNIPRYYANPDNYIFSIFNDESTFKEYISEEIDFKEKDDANEINKIEYKYNYTHPILKKKFMGPSKLEVEDVFKIYFVSSNCLIVEIFSYMSGFMMMDTFYSILQYKFETTPSYNESLGRIVYETNVTISLMIEFVKENWFKSKILAEAQADMDECVKTMIIPSINKVVLSQKNKFMKDFKKNKISCSLMMPILEENNNINEMIDIIEINNENNKIQRNDSFKIVDLSNQFTFSQKEIDKREEENIINNDLPVNNQFKAQQQAYAQAKQEIMVINNDIISSLLSSKENIIKLIALMTILLILFFILPFSSLLIIIINLIGFYFIFYRLNRILSRVDELHRLFLKS